MNSKCYVELCDPGDVELVSHMLIHLFRRFTTVSHRPISCLLFHSRLKTRLFHGNAPSEFVSSTVIPIPKGKGLNPTDSAKNRGIALSSIYGKLFDLIVLHKFSDQLSTSPLKFGSKAKRSTSMCMMVG